MLYLDFDELGKWWVFDDDDDSDEPYAGPYNTQKEASVAYPEIEFCY